MWSKVQSTGGRSRPWSSRTFMTWAFSVQGSTHVPAICLTTY